MTPSINHQLEILEHVKAIESILGNYERIPGNRIDRLFEVCPNREKILEVMEEGDIYPQNYAPQENQPL